jgi:hypothetical protein
MLIDFVVDGPELFYDVAFTCSKCHFENKNRIQDAVDFF